ncbi:GRAM domain-containing protein 2B isoform X2 [Danio aesculapii]|uniref:GRAM domain-containing protein 2B isoform X2 n=1 Tax=Danio aesculapii TaxID=1142201 RepID=UPI0024BFD882|nr:GRAM domain-containing protein 2B isoform X2 [Danio aesculapii]
MCEYNALMYSRSPDSDSSSSFIMSSRKISRRCSLDSSGYRPQTSGVTVKPKSIMRRSSDSKTFQSAAEAQLELLEKNNSQSLRIEEEVLDRSDGSAVPNGFRQHNRSFHRLFPEVPELEDLEHVFTCALQKELIYQGKMFVSRQHICFHSSVLLKETKVIIQMSSVQSIQKKHTAKFVPNALAVVTNDGLKHLFVSLLNREVCYRLLQSFCPHLQTESISRKSSVSSAEENQFIHLSEEACSESAEHQPQDLNTSTDEHTRGKNTAEQHNTGVSRLSEKLKSLLCSRNSLGLNTLLLFYLVLALLLLLSSGYIGLRIVALEEQLSILGSLQNEYQEP